MGSVKPRSVPLPRPVRSATLFAHEPPPKSAAARSCDGQEHSPPGVHGLPSRYRAGTEGAVDAIESIGFVQIDTISVVERAHHHILWSRVPGYERGMVAALEGNPRRVLEYWLTPPATYR